MGEIRQGRGVGAFLGGGVLQEKKTILSIKDIDGRGEKQARKNRSGEGRSDLLPAQMGGLYIQKKTRPDDAGNEASKAARKKEKWA